MNNLLEVNNISAFYGTVRALHDMSFFVNKGEIVVLLGPNGAGKSTALKSVCGLVSVKKGEIKFQNEEILGDTPDRLVKKGLSLVPEGRRIFKSMSVQENLEMGAYTIKNKNKAIIKENLDNVFQLFPILKERRKQKAGTLSTGEQQMLSIGRALMLNPTLLLLDEPSLGLSPNYVNRIYDRLVEINKNGTSLLIVEQNIQKAFEICSRGYILKNGSVEFEGNKKELIENLNILM